MTQPMSISLTRPIRILAAAGLLASATLALAAGSPVDTQSAGNQQSPDVARTASGASVVVWSGKADDANLSEILARRYDAAGNPVGDPFQVNQATRLRQYLPRVAMAADGSFLVAWLSEINAPAAQVFARRYAADGTPLGAEFRLDTDSPFNVTVGLGVDMNAAGDAVVVWGRRRAFGGLSALDIRSIEVRQASSAGQLGAELHAVTNPLPVLRAPSVGVAPDGDFVVIWHSDSDSRLLTGIYARRYRANGRAYRPLRRRVSRPAINRDVVAVDTPKIAFGPDGNYTIAWGGYAADSTPVSVFLRRFNSNGRPLDAGQQVGTGLTQPSIAIDASNRLTLVAAGRDIVMKHFRANGEIDSSQIVESNRPFKVLAPEIGVDANGRSLIVWEDFGRDGDGQGVYARADAGTPSISGAVADDN